MFDWPNVQIQSPSIVEEYSINPQKIALRELDTLSIDQLDADWNLYEYFGTIYVINLDKATERLEKIKEDLSKIGVNKFERFKATDGTCEVEDKLLKKFNRNWAKIDTSTYEGQKKLERQFQGEAGCYISHYRLIKKIKECYDQAVSDLEKAQQLCDLNLLQSAINNVRKYQSVLILEDDNRFGKVSEDKQTASKKGLGKIFREVMRELPQDWDLLYFMALSSTPSEPYTPHLRKLIKGACLNAYAINAKMYEPLLKQLEKIFYPDTEQIEPIDNEFAQMHTLHNCYVIEPAIAYQDRGLSFITSKVATHLRQTTTVPPPPQP